MTFFYTFNKILFAENILWIKFIVLTPLPFFLKAHYILLDLKLVFLSKQKYTWFKMW